MNSAEIKVDLLNTIDTLSIKQLKEIYGLLQNYFNAEVDTEEWNALSLAQQDKINKGIDQADAGMTRPLSEVTGRLRRKYRFNG